ncbi:MAG: DUF5714 domain-containing protein [Desulfobacterales bacterium]
MTSLQRLCFEQTPIYVLPDRPDWFVPDPRQMVQKAVGAIIGEIAETRAARCCRRESYTALIHAARWSEHILPIALEAGEIPECRQQTANRECIEQACPYIGETRQSLAAEMQ